MNLSLLIHTFNDYKRFWPGAIASISEFIPDVPKYFGTDAADHGKFDFKDFNVLYSGYGSWSDRLTRLLLKIPTDYVFYMQEDQWPTQKPPDLVKMMQIMTENNLFRLQISPNVRFYTLKNAENPAFFDLKSKYLISHQPSIWRKNFLLDQIRYNENPWINEYEGTKRLNSDPSIENRIAIYDCDWFKHKCIKGSAVEMQ
jgi:hypothetical protein